ncbi:hypothetical protein KBB27_03700 [Patescibacteria group bacterium]|nr:hypothetical protein [Patescibacteria group bacterium]
MRESLLSENKKSIERQFFAEDDRFIIERGLEVLWGKLHEWREKNELPTHIVLMDTSGRAFAPAVKRVMDAFYGACGYATPSIAFVVPDRPLAMWLRDQYGEEWKAVLTQIKTKQLFEKMRDYEYMLSEEGELPSGYTKEQIERERNYVLQKIKDIFKEMDEIEQNEHYLEDRFLEILKKTHADVEGARMLIIDDYLFEGTTMRLVSEAIDHVGIEANFFTFFFTEEDLSQSQEEALDIDWSERSAILEKLGSRFCYGSTQWTKNPNGRYLKDFKHYRFQTGVIITDGEYEDVSKGTILGYEKNKQNPTMYAKPVRDPARDLSLMSGIREGAEESEESLMRGIRRESAELGQHVVNKMLGN